MLSPQDIALFLQKGKVPNAVSKSSAVIDAGDFLRGLQSAGAAIPPSHAEAYQACEAVLADYAARYPGGVALCALPRDEASTLFLTTAAALVIARAATKQGGERGPL